MTIPAQWGRIETGLLPLLREHFTGLSLGTKKARQVAPYKFVLVRADLQQRVTPISRYCRIGVSVWSITAAGEPDFADAQTIAANIGTFIEQIPAAHNTPILTAEVDSGPLRLMDDIAGIEFAYLNVLTHVRSA